MRSVRARLSLYGSAVLMMKRWRGKLVADVVTGALAQSLAHLVSAKVVLQSGVVLVFVVEYHAALHVYHGHAHVRLIVILHVCVDSFLRHVPVHGEYLRHTLVVVLQTRVEHVNLVSFLPVVLENDKRNGEEQENRHYAEIQFCAY